MGNAIGRVCSFLLNFCIFFKLKVNVIYRISIKASGIFLSVNLFLTGLFGVSSIKKVSDRNTNENPQVEVTQIFLQN